MCVSAGQADQRRDLTDKVVNPVVMAKGEFHGGGRLQQGAENPTCPDQERQLVTQGRVHDYCMVQG